MIIFWELFEILVNNLKLVISDYILFYFSLLSKSLSFGIAFAIIANHGFKGSYAD